MTITINSDMGEALGIHAFGNDEALLEIVDVANVACGFHSGEPGTMRRTVENAVAAGVKVGAHPGLPDLVGFGRREMKLYPDEVRDLVTYQVGALTAFLDAAGANLNHIKPHGSLYGMVGRDEALMDALCDVALQYGVPIYGLAGTEHQRGCERRGVPFVGEFYVDLGYSADGGLLIVRRPSATDVGEAADKARVALTEGLGTAVTGERFAVTFDSICVHSDAPNAVEVATAVRRAVTESQTTRGL
jgi:UPF0271 protein